MPQRIGKILLFLIVFTGLCFSEKTHAVDDDKLITDVPFVRPTSALITEKLRSVIPEAKLDSLVTLVNQGLRIAARNPHPQNFPNPFGLGAQRETLFEKFIFLLTYEGETDGLDGGQAVSVDPDAGLFLTASDGEQGWNNWTLVFFLRVDRIPKASLETQYGYILGCLLSTLYGIAPQHLRHQTPAPYLDRSFSPDPLKQNEAEVLAIQKLLSSSESLGTEARLELEKLLAPRTSLKSVAEGRITAHEALGTRRLPWQGNIPFATPTELFLQVEMEDAVSQGVLPLLVSTIEEAIQLVRRFPPAQIATQNAFVWEGTPRPVALPPVKITLASNCSPTFRTLLGTQIAYYVFPCSSITTYQMGPDGSQTYLDVIIPIETALFDDATQTLAKDALPRIAAALAAEFYVYVQKHMIGEVSSEKRVLDLVETDLLKAELLKEEVAFMERVLKDQDFLKTLDSTKRASFQRVRERTATLSREVSKLCKSLLELRVRGQI